MDFPRTVEHPTFGQRHSSTHRMTIFLFAVPWIAVLVFILLFTRITKHTGVVATVAERRT